MPRVKKQVTTSSGEDDSHDEIVEIKVPPSKKPPVHVEIVPSEDEDEIYEAIKSKRRELNGHGDNSLPVVKIKQEPRSDSPEPVISAYFARVKSIDGKSSTARRSALSSSSSEDDDEDKEKPAKSTGRVKFPISVFSRPSTLTVFEANDGVNRNTKPYKTVARKPPKKVYRHVPKGPVKKRRFIVSDDESELSASGSGSEDSDSSGVSDISDTIAKARSERAVKRRKILDESDEKAEKKKKKKIKKSKSLDSDAEPDAELSSSSEDDEYEDRERLSSSSDDEIAVKKRVSKTKIVKSAEQIEFENETRKTLRERVVKFMNEATLQELATVKSISTRTAKFILDARPFEDYADMKDKIGSVKQLNSETIEKAVEAVRSRDDLRCVMMQCESLSNAIKSKIDLVTPASQPAFLNPKCKLMDYQLIGLNWMAVMYQQGINAILADEMGLGKTIQVIAFLAYLKEVQKVNGPHLIVVPASTLDNWDREFSTWAPKFDLLVYHGSINDRLELRTKISKKKIKYEILLTTYSMVFAKDDSKFLKNQNFFYSVYDEAHLLKNMRTIKYHKLLRLKSKYRLMLTGTPLQNNLLELMSLLVFTMPEIFLPKINSVTSLFTMNNFNTVFSANSNAASDDYVSPFERDRIEHAKSMLHPFILRRVKANVLKALPKKTVIVQKVPMTKAQKKVYDQIISASKKSVQLNDALADIDPDDVEKENADKPSPVKNDKSEVKYSGLSILMNLRKVANHQLLIRHHYDDKKLTKMSELMLNEPSHHDANAKYIKEDMELLSDHELHVLCVKYKSLSKFKLSDSSLLSSGKLQFMDKILPDLFASGEKVLVFSQFCITLDLIEFYMRKRGYPYVRLDGSTKIHERLDLIDGFNNDNDDVLENGASDQDEIEEEVDQDEENSRASKSSKGSAASSNSTSKSKKIFAFLLTTKAGGIGINLTSASTAILHDIDFNPYNDKQAEDRCHRLGQTKDVTIYKLISEGTIEEGILSLAEKKMKLGEDIQATREALASNNSPIKSPSKASNRLAKMTRSKDMRNLLKRTLGIS